MTEITPKTPCIGRCSTTFGDEICKGCGRTYVQVIQWNGLSNTFKIEIKENINELRRKAATKFIKSINESILLDEIAVRELNYKSVSSNLYLLAYRVLETTNFSPEVFGIILKDEYTGVQRIELVRELYKEYDSLLADYDVQH